MNCGHDGFTIQGVKRMLEHDCILRQPDIVSLLIGCNAVSYTHLDVYKRQVVTVPDERLNVLGEMYHTKKIIPAAIEFVDIAGLVKGASKGEGLGNQFLANIREVDAIVHVVRCFEDSNIVHVDGSIDPMRDVETINLELILSLIHIFIASVSIAVSAASLKRSCASRPSISSKR